MVKKRKTVKIKKGDVFRFNVSENNVAYGQIAIPGNVIYVIVYRNLLHSALTFAPELLTDIALCGWTLDGRIYHRMWEIVGNVPLPDNIPRPCYKVGIDGVLWVKSFEGEPVRLASDNDCQSLDYRTTISPITFEEAIAAIHGLQEWDASFDKMLVKYARERERIC